MTQKISIHALLAESDWHTKFKEEHMKNFYPRSPCGERPDLVQKKCAEVVISIHALLAESDGYRAGRD